MNIWEKKLIMKNQFIIGHGKLIFLFFVLLLQIFQLVIQYFFHSLKTPGLRVDIAEDITKLNLLALNSLNTGCLTLAGGIVKHHIFNANAMRS